MSSQSSSISDAYSSNSAGSFEDKYPRSRPLIEYCTNEWQKDPKYISQGSVSGCAYNESKDFYDYLEDCLEGCLSVIKAPKFRRLLLALFVLTTTTVLVWVKVIQPWIIEEMAARASLAGALSKGPRNLFGANFRPKFSGMTHLTELDPALLPSLRGPKKRLIFVGDIHGCKNQLLALMEKVGFNADTDHLIATGDVINKGPDTLGVVDFLMDNHASCVRGNHEDTMLLMANAMKNPTHGSSRLTGDRVGNFKPDDPLAKLVGTFSKSQLDWLRSLPVILRIGNVSGIGEVVVVHGGLVPGVGLDDQDPVSVMNMRTIDLETHMPSKNHEKPGSIPWYRLWNRYQALVPAQSKWTKLFNTKPKYEDHRVLVVYGHDAKKGLQDHKYSKGLDSNCVTGGKLSALVISAGGKQEIAQVDCPSYAKTKAKKQTTEEVLRPGSTES